MLKEPINIQNKFGLHTRAAAKLVATAAGFESKITLQHGDKTADCKSIMAVILLGATNRAQLELAVTGADELDARDAIVDLFKNKFGETE